jgi:hypothetical protein
MTLDESKKTQNKKNTRMRNKRNQKNGNNTVRRGRRAINIRMHIKKESKAKRMKYMK